MSLVPKRVTASLKEVGQLKEGSSSATGVAIPNGSGLIDLSADSLTLGRRGKRGSANTFIRGGVIKIPGLRGRGRDGALSQSQARMWLAMGLKREVGEKGKEKEDDDDNDDEDGDDDEMKVVGGNRQ
ncbi:hypothetical protein TARUN_7643 [Trichoderma arundinaceum]|uniref:Uncharacterized protein n=1 Tax=Trichoderma arundinaceum TaxID=490622 RepID=A0A395NFI6_TRIAR|nr:hypothetical protein TARUN_7643 [Trichoderma arundinaceum]